MTGGEIVVHVVVMRVCIFCRHDPVDIAPQKVGGFIAEKPFAGLVEGQHLRTIIDHDNAVGAVSKTLARRASVTAALSSS